MAKQTKLRQIYGLETGLVEVNPLPIISNQVPSPNDKNFPLGQVWLRQTSNGAVVYMLSTVVNGSAKWSLLGSGIDDLENLRGDSGGTVSPNSSTIDLVGGTNITTVGDNSNATITFNLDPAITLATSVTSPLYTAGASTDVSITAPTGQDIIVKLGDNSGANKASITDSTDTEVASIDSNGVLSAATVAATSVTSLLYTVAASNNVAITAPTGQDVVIQLGDDAAANKLSITNSSGTEVYSIDSTGTAGYATASKHIAVKGDATRGSIGSANLSSGEVIIENKDVTSNDRIFTQRSAINGSSDLGVLCAKVLPGRGLAIESLKMSNPKSLEKGDSSTVEYFIVREV